LPNINAIMILDMSFVSGRSGPFCSQLLKFIVCPVTRTELRYDAERHLLVSEAAGLAYRIRDGVPILLVEKAIKLSSINGADFYKSDQK